MPHTVTTTVTSVAHRVDLVYYVLDSFVILSCALVCIYVFYNASIISHTSHWRRNDRGPTREPWSASSHMTAKKTGSILNWLLIDKRTLVYKQE
ncbi:hypothetical protein CC80DRAFT_14937 [Byssothecium circinans]|uniref:Uncharacterized protein n=1 Tax=Byssothecium circinans TaxID=147558 RepID=A0A6A5U1P9_9PLEO|nr:hypothetical protein CC80DRAFT_14937 [Byssothecium circinans]